MSETIYKSKTWHIVYDSWHDKFFLELTSYKKLPIGTKLFETKEAALDYLRSISYRTDIYSYREIYEIEEYLKNDSGEVLKVESNFFNFLPEWWNR